MFVGPRKSYGRLRAKGYFVIGIMLRWPRFMSRGKTLNTGSDSYSSFNWLLPSYIDTSEESSLDGLPEALASFDLYKYSPGEFLKRFCARRSRDRSRERRSGASLVEFEMEQNTIRRMQIWNKDGASEWWTGIVSLGFCRRNWSVANEEKEINLKGSYIMTHYFIQSQLNPKEPTGTIITVRSGRAGITAAGGLTYNISKIVEQRLNEHLQLGNSLPSQFLFVESLSN